MKNLEKKIGQFFDGQSSYYDEKKEISNTMKYHITSILDAEINSALDVGSGTGTLIIELAKGGVTRIYGIDLSEDMTKVARKKVEEAGFSEQIQLQNGSFLESPITEEIEALSMHRVLCCHPDKEGMIDKTIQYQPKIITISIPREWLVFRIPLFIFGLFAKIFNTFRPYIHSQKSIDQQMEANGYKIRDRKKEKWWITTTYEKVE